ncbi:MAG: beta-L-arabinofuranosidase domain-containing protein [Steroidobacteraceae bacterium]
MPNSGSRAVAPEIRLGGLLGDALEANRRGRLSHFIVDETSPAIALFGPAHAERNEAGDWYGEHAGKWLYAAAKAASRGGDAALGERVRRVATHLAGLQRADGYLGTYAPARRFMAKQPRAPQSWDGAPARRTWDIWTHSYLVLGLLETHRHFPDPAYLMAARRIGDLCWHTLTAGGIDITDLGNHHGMSAAVLLDPAVELFRATAEPRYLELAQLIVRQAEGRAELRLLSAASAGVDASEIGTGKAYQLCWLLVGLAKLHRATGDPALLASVRRVHENIRAHHLTLGGGPWGGVAHRSREVFNPAGFFSPEGFVETCSTFSWIQLNRELLDITGEASFAEEIERSAYNDLLGAQAPDGEDWCYYSFPNGRRVHTTAWRCCKSSGAMALEELPEIAYRLRADGAITVNLYGPGRASIATEHAGRVTLEQATRYPFADDIRIRVNPERPARFPILLRIPGWCERPGVRVNGAEAPAKAGSYVSLERDWRAGDEIAMQLPMAPVLHRATNRNVQESRGPAGETVRQEVLCTEYVALTRGPLVYATGLIDGYRTGETIRLPESGHAELLELLDSAGPAPPTIRLTTAGRPPLECVPYYMAGGRVDGAWRVTWLRIAPVK